MGSDWDCDHLRFFSAADFLVLAERLGVVPARGRRIIARFTDDRHAAQAESLIQRSFLSAKAREPYLAVVTDRRRALLQPSR